MTGEQLSVPHDVSDRGLLGAYPIDDRSRQHRSEHRPGVVERLGVVAATSDHVGEHRRVVQSQVDGESVAGDLEKLPGLPMNRDVVLGVLQRIGCEVAEFHPELGRVAESKIAVGHG